MDPPSVTIYVENRMCIGINDFRIFVLSWPFLFQNQENKTWAVKG